MPKSIAQDGAIISWEPPEGADEDWLVGAAATRAERSLNWGTSLAAAICVVVLVAMGRTPNWAWWQVLVVAAIAFDVVGGAVANATSAVKRQYGRVRTGRRRILVRVATSKLGFTSLHLHPVVIAVLFPGPSLLWGLGWYLAVLAGVALVEASPLYLRRPVAMTTYMAILFVAVAFPVGAGWSWFIPAIAAKLVLAHAVPEEPYRPAVGT